MSGWKDGTREIGRMWEDADFSPTTNPDLNELRDPGSLEYDGPSFLKQLQQNQQAYLIKNMLLLERQNGTFWGSSGWQNIQGAAGAPHAQEFQTNYQTFIPIVSDAETTPPLVFSKIAAGKAASVEFFMKEITTAQMALLVPQVRIFKIEPEEGGEGKSTTKNATPVEIIFDDVTRRGDVEMIFANRRGKLAGSGIKSFSWALKGVNPAEVDRNIEAELKIYFNDVSNIFYDQNRIKRDSAGIEGIASFLDLIIYSPPKNSKTSKDSKRSLCSHKFYNGKNFEIRADIGWAIPPATSAEVQKLFTPFQLEALEAAQTSLYLQLVKHKFDFRMDGTAELTINYRARYNNKSRPYDLLSVDLEDLNSKIKDMQEQMKDVEGSKSGGSDRFKEQIKTTEGQKNAILADRYAYVMKAVATHIKQVPVDPEALGLFDPGWAMGGITAGARKKQLAEASRRAANASGRQSQDRGWLSKQGMERIFGSTTAMRMGAGSGTDINIYDTGRQAEVEMNASVQAYRRLLEEAKKENSDLNNVVEGGSLSAAAKKDPQATLAAIVQASEGDDPEKADAAKKFLKPLGDQFGDYFGKATNILNPPSNLKVDAASSDTTAGISEYSYLFSHQVGNPDSKKMVMSAVEQTNKASKLGILAKTPVGQVHQAVEAALKPGTLQIPFLYLGDIIDAVILGPTTGADPGVSGIVNLLNSRQVGILTLDVQQVDPYAVMRKVALQTAQQIVASGNNNVGEQITENMWGCGLDALTHQEKVNFMKRLNIANIPVHYDLFYEWFVNKVVTPAREVYYFENFLADLLQQFVKPALSNKTLPKAPPSQTSIGYTRLQLDTNQRFTEEAYQLPLAAKGGKGNKGYEIGYLIDKKMIPFVETVEGKPFPKIGTAVAHTEFKVLHMTSMNAATAIGDPDLDAAMGIYHFTIGSDRGILKAATFNRADMPYLGEARVDRTRFAGAEQLRDIYHVNLKLYGTTLIKPGQFIYIAPNQLTFGDPSERNSLARILGMGGYHLVIDVSSEISEDGYETTVKALHQAMPAINQL